MTDAPRVTAGSVSSPSGHADPAPARVSRVGVDGPLELCFACMRYHAPPGCGHNAEAPCLFCLGRRGYRWTGDDGQEAGRANQCWTCWWKQEKRNGHPHTRAPGEGG